jgi:catechol 2,3-dioxygenase-like lactoylglutathione lyase family enzyme
MSRTSLHNPGRPVALRLGALELEAFSISGLATYVLVPALEACFDLGHCSVEASRVRNVLLSHVHQDHALGVVRHLALRVADMGASVAWLAAQGVAVEPVRTDPVTGDLFTFFADPDGLPIELVAPSGAAALGVSAG